MSVPFTLSSVPAQTPYIQYVSGVSQTVFPYPFAITQDTDLVVLLNGVAQPTDSGYTVSGQGTTGGGNVTFTAGLTSGTIVTLYRNIQISRVTQLSQNGTFFSTNFNNEYNRIYLILQQLQQSLLPGGNQAYALMIPNSNNPAATTLLTPAAYANKYLSFDSNGNPQPALLTVNGTVTAASIASLLNGTPQTITIYTAQTTAEVAAAVVPTNYFYQPGDVHRYGAVGDGVTNDYAAINAAIQQFNNGGVLPRFRGLVYATGTALVPPNNLILDLNRATIKPSGSADGFDVTANFCGIKNGRIDMTNSTGRGIYSAVAGGAALLTFEDVYILCGSGTGIELVDVYNVTLERMRCNSGSGRAVYIRSSIPSTPVNSVWMNRLQCSNFTGTADTVTLEGCVGCTIFEGDFEVNNNASGSVVIHISTNANAGSTGNKIQGCYFEDGAAQLGTCILVGSPPTGSVVSSANVITDNYFASSKQHVSLGTFVTQDDAPIVHNTFIPVGGLPSAAVVVSGGLVPNCHSNSGAILDIVRTFTPTLLFGGANVGMTGTFTGEYRRVANKISGDIKITLTAAGSSIGLATIGGLPLTSSANDVVSGVTVGYYNNMTGLTAAPIIGRIGPSNTTISLSQATATTVNDLSNGFFTNTSVLYVHFEYEV